MLITNPENEVHIFEKNSQVGGRNSNFTLNHEGEDFVFDIGPTFLQIPSILQETFKRAGEEMSDYLDVQRLPLMYRLNWEDKCMNMYDSPEKMEEELASIYPEEIEGYRKYLQKERIRFEHLIPCLSRDYSSIKQLFNSTKLIKALPHLALGKSVLDVL